MSSNNFIKISKEGLFQNDQTTIEDPIVGQNFFSNLKHGENGNLLTNADGVDAYVESYDRPIVALSVKPIAKDLWLLQTTYGQEFNFSLSKVFLDEWDRFVGFTDNKFEFVMSEDAQNEFFDQLDEFDDDSVTYKGVQFQTPLFVESQRNVSSADFWCEKYKSDTAPGWELDAPAKPLVEVVAQLKLPRSRIAVLGCGSGNDAAFFAEQGHLVTAFDFSAEAIALAMEKYGHLENLTFVHEDIFVVSEQFHDAFDIVFEHTCFVAIDPKRRSELVDVWNKLLNDGGHLLGVFLLTNHRDHPPFSVTEWELNEKLKNAFHNLYWTRWRQSISPRLGRELVVYSKKRNSSMDPQE